MKKVNTFDWIVLVLVIIGALNWGLVGFFDWDLVAKIFGDMSTVTRIVYDIVGLAGVWLIFILPKLARGGSKEE